MSKINKLSLAQAKEMKKKGKKLYFVGTRYEKYPFMYVYATGSKQAKSYARERPPSDFYDFPERPRTWEIIGEVEAVSEEEMEELDLFDKEHPEAD